MGHLPHQEGCEL